MSIYMKASDAWDELPSEKQGHLESFSTGYITAYVETQQEISELKKQLAFEKGRNEQRKKQMKF